MIRVMLVDDHAVVREGYRRLLELQGDVQVVAEAGDGGEALRVLRDIPVDVAVVDLGLPGLGGLELMARLRQRGERCRVLAFSMHRDPVWAAQALRAGALGYVTKSSPPDQLVAAVREVNEGRRQLSSDIASATAAALQDGMRPGVAVELSPREFEIMRSLVEGRPVADILTPGLHGFLTAAINEHTRLGAEISRCFLNG